MLRQMDQTFDSSIPWMEDQAIRIASSSQTSRRLGPRSSMERKSPSQSLPKPTSSAWEVDLWEVARVDVGWSLAGKKNSQEYVATGKKWVIYLLLRDLYWNGWPMLAIWVRKCPWWSCGFWGYHFFRQGHMVCFICWDYWTLHAEQKWSLLKLGMMAITYAYTV